MVLVNDKPIKIGVAIHGRCALSNQSAASLLDHTDQQRDELEVCSGTFYQYRPVLDMDNCDPGQVMDTTTACSPSVRRGKCQFGSSYVLPEACPPCLQ